MREVEFHEPVFVGDIVSFYTETVRVGRTSVTVRVSVEAERWGSAADRGRGRSSHGERVKVTEAEVVLVAVNDARAARSPIRPGVRSDVVHEVGQHPRRLAAGLVHRRAVCRHRA